MRDGGREDGAERGEAEKDTRWRRAVVLMPEAMPAWSIGAVPMIAFWVSLFSRLSLLPSSSIASLTLRYLPPSA